MSADDHDVTEDEVIALNPHLKISFFGDDEVLVKHGARSIFSKSIFDEGRTKLIGKLLRNVVTPTPLAELLNNGVFSSDQTDDVRELVRYLQDEGILVDIRMDVTQAYLDTILEKGNRLSTKKVGTIGAGYLGSRIAEEMAVLGIGELVVLDERKIEAEEVERRYLRLLPQTVVAGKPLGACLSDHLNEFVQYDHVTNIDGSTSDLEKLMAVFDDVDFVIASYDSLSARELHAANIAAIETETPWMSAYVDGSEACIGPIYIPGNTCCYNEFEIQQEAAMQKNFRNEFLTYKESLNDDELFGRHLTLPPYISIAAGMSAMSVMRFLSSGRSHLIQRCTRIDFERLSIDYEEVFSLPRCPACTKRPDYRNLFL